MWPVAGCARSAASTDTLGVAAAGIGTCPIHSDYRREFTWNVVMSRRGARRVRGAVPSRRSGVFWNPQRQAPRGSPVPGAYGSLELTRMHCVE